MRHRNTTGGRAIDAGRHTARTPFSPRGRCDQKSKALPRSTTSFFEANYAALTRLIYRVVGDIGWAEELAAEAFWKLHCNPPASDHNLVGWL